MRIIYKILITLFLILLNLPYAQEYKTGAILLTDEQLEKVPYGSLTPPHISPILRVLSNDISQSPVCIDLSEDSAFPAIYNQGKIGSCTAFATTYYQFTYEVSKKLGWVQSKDSENQNDNKIFSPKWIYNLIAKSGDSGSNAKDAYDFLQRVGAVTNADFKYNGEEADSYKELPNDVKLFEKALNYRVGYGAENGLFKYDSTDALINKIKAELRDEHIVTFSTKDANRWYYTKIKNKNTLAIDEEYKDESICIYHAFEKHDSHALTIVGYNDTIWADINQNDIVDSGELGAFKVANSWGKQWTKEKKYCKGGGYELDSEGNSIVTKSGFIWLSYDAIKKESQLVSNTIIRRQAITDNVIGLIHDIEIRKKPKLKLYASIKTGNIKLLDIEVMDKYVGIKPSGSSKEERCEQGFDGDFVLDIDKYSFGDILKIKVENLGYKSTHPKIDLIDFVLMQDNGNGGYTSYRLDSLIREYENGESKEIEIYLPKEKYNNGYIYDIGPLSLNKKVLENAVYGLNHVFINDRANVYNEDKTDYAQVQSTGVFSLNNSSLDASDMRIGVGANVGDVYTTGRVFNRGGNIHGDIFAQGYSEQLGGSVSGIIDKKNKASLMPKMVSFNQNIEEYFNGKLSNSNIEVNRYSDEEENDFVLTPSTKIGKIKVNEGGILTFSEDGIYHLKSLNIEAGGIIDCNDKKIVLLIEDDFKFGDRAELRGDAEDIILATFTRKNVFIGNEIVWNGMFIAPRASYIHLYNKKSSVFGQFIGTSIQLHQDGVIQYVETDLDDYEIEHQDDYKPYMKIFEDKNALTIGYNNIQTKKGFIKLVLDGIVDTGRTNKDSIYNITDINGEINIPDLNLIGSDGKQYPSIQAVITLNVKTFTGDSIVIDHKRSLHSSLDDSSRAKIDDLRVQTPLSLSAGKVFFNIKDGSKIPESISFVLSCAQLNLEARWQINDLVEGDNSFYCSEIPEIMNLRARVDGNSNAVWTLSAYINNELIDEINISPILK